MNAAFPVARKLSASWVFMRTVAADADKFRKAREQSGLTVEALAKKARVSKRSVENAQKGSNVYLSTLKALTEAMRVDFSDVLPNTTTKKYVEVVIRGDLETINHEHVQRLVTLINLLLDGEVKMVGEPREGSIIITLEMSEADAIKLIEMAPTLKRKLKALTTPKRLPHGRRRPKPLKPPKELIEFIDGIQGVTVVDAK